MKTLRNGKIVNFTVIPYSKAPVLAPPPLARRGSVRKAEKKAIRRNYGVYLQMPHWRAIRDEIIKRAKGACEDCGAKTRFLQVHHLTYRRAGKELPTDLLALCDPCHKKRHKITS